MVFTHKGVLLMISLDIIEYYVLLLAVLAWLIISTIKTAIR